MPKEQIDLQALREKDLGKIADFLRDLLLDSSRSPTKAAVLQIVDLVYRGSVGRLKPLLQILPEVSKPLGKDAGLALAGIIGVLGEAAQSPQLRTAMKALGAGRAKIRKDALDTHVKAGFTRAEAMALVLADINSLQQAGVQGFKIIVEADAK